MAGVRRRQSNATHWAVEQFLTNHPELAGRWKELSSALNKAGITNSEGGTWSQNGIFQFMKRLQKEAETAPAEAERPDVTHVVAPETQPTTPETEPLSPVTREEIKAIAKEVFREEFHSMTTVNTTAAEARPSFKRGKSVPRSVRIDERLLRAAEHLVMDQEARYGRSFNELVELLLWQEVGRPAWMLREPKTTEE